MLINLAIFKYSIENFSLDILEYCSAKDVIQKEQHYLDTYKPIYNILKIAGYSFGYVHNETSLTKMNLVLHQKLLLIKWGSVNKPKIKLEKL